MVTAYCVKCRKKVDIKNSKKVKFQTKTGTRFALKGTCGKCGTKVTRFVKG